MIQIPQENSAEMSPDILVFAGFTEINNVLPTRLLEFEAEAIILELQLLKNKIKSQIKKGGCSAITNLVSQ